jgi:hypothetical protein
MDYREQKEWRRQEQNQRDMTMLLIKVLIFCIWRPLRLLFGTPRRALFSSVLLVVSVHVLSRHLLQFIYINGVPLNSYLP